MSTFRGPNPTCGPLIVAMINGSDGFTSKFCLWKQRVLYQKKKRRVQWCEPFTRAWCSWHVRRCLRNKQCGQKESEGSGSGSRKRAWVPHARVTWMMHPFSSFHAGQSFWVLSLTTRKSRAKSIHFNWAWCWAFSSFGPGISKWTSGVVQFSKSRKRKYQKNNNNDRDLELIEKDLQP